MAKTMKAAVVEKPNLLTVKQVPVPQIAEEEVLIRVKYTGICGTDWSIFTGKYSADKLPMIPGHEFSGTVAQVGKKARGLKEGDRVTADINMSCGICFYCRKGQKLMCRDFRQLGIHMDGTYAEYVKAPYEQVHKLPDGLDFLAGAFVEPVSCVIHSSKAAGITHGSSVAILGAGLGVLHAALARQRAAAPVIVQLTLLMGLSLLAQVGLGFLGVGLQPPFPSWGSAFAESFPYIIVSPQATFAPGIVVAVTVLALYRIGDELRDRLTGP